MIVYAEKQKEWDQQKLTEVQNSTDAQLGDRLTEKLIWLFREPFWSILSEDFSRKNRKWTPKNISSISGSSKETFMQKQKVNQ